MSFPEIMVTHVLIDWFCFQIMKKMVSGTLGIATVAADFTSLFKDQFS